MNEVTKKKINWSVSRLKTYEGCKLRYALQYVDHWKAVGQPENELQGKGLALHETFEHYQSGTSYEDAEIILNENLKAHPVDEEKFNVREGLKRFCIFWKEFIEPKEKEGYVISRECEIKADDIKGESFIGYIDLLLEKEDSVIIFDYKTASTMNAGGYMNQLITYAYMIGLRKGWDIKQIAEKTKLYVFFPLGKITAKKIKTDEERALYSVKEIVFAASDVDAVVEGFLKDIDTIHETDFSAIDPEKDASYSFACNWCPYIGSIPTRDGFPGCPTTYNRGCRQLPCVSFTK